MNIQSDICVVTVLGLYGHMGMTAHHEASAVIVRDGEILAAVEEDRITRVKHDGQIPNWNSLKEVLRISGVKAGEIDAVAIPQESPVRTYFKGLRHPSRVTLPAYYYLRADKNRLRDVLSAFGINANLHFVNHHESHAASAFLSSGFENCSVLTLDGAGDRHESISLWEGHANQMKRVVVIDGPTFGDFFVCATHAIGFKINDGEGKTMGLACYGDSKVVYEKIKNFITVDNLSVKGLPYDLTLQVNVNDETPFAIYRHITAKNNPFTDIVRFHKIEDVAAAAQRLLEEKVLELVRNAIHKTGQRKICLAGGVALNMKLNQRIREMQDVEEVFVFPNPGDSGLPVGAAMLVCKEVMEAEGKQFQNHPMTHTYYGTEYTDEDVVKALDEYRLEYEVVDNPQSAAADLIAEGKVVGWFQGKLEFGPRALGNRSVLADPRDGKMKDKINKYLKKRDWFMPFAPSILSEAKYEYLENAVEAPFMIMGFNVKPNKLRDIPAVLHVDHTVRPQTVTREMNDSYWRLIREFEKRSGIPAVLNTSFNRHGQPMVRSPSDAALHVVWGCVEYLVIHKYLVDAKVRLT